MSAARSRAQPPPTDETPWAALDPAAKRDRLLAAATTVFAEHGLDAPMPAVARAAGAGVGSLYRQFASKEDLVAALAERRLRWLEAELDAALATADAWSALKHVIELVLGEDAADDVSAQAVATAATDAPVREARERVRSHLDALIARAREQGSIRDDLTRSDVVIVINAARSSRQLGPGAWRRALDLMYDGLRQR